MMDYIFLGLAGVAIVGLLGLVVFWAAGRLRERRIADLDSARPKCKHGRHAFGKCEDCDKETRAFFEEKERVLSPLVICDPRDAININSVMTTGAFFFENEDVTLKTGVGPPIHHIRLPRKGEVWVPMRCPKLAFHGVGIPFRFSWVPTDHENERAICGCLVPHFNQRYL